MAKIIAIHGLIGEDMPHLKTIDNVGVQSDLVDDKNCVMVRRCIVPIDLSTHITNVACRTVEDAANGSQKGSLAGRVFQGKREARVMIALRQFLRVRIPLGPPNKETQWKTGREA